MELAVGTRLPELTLPAMTRHALALYCGASGDHNPVHVDIDFARQFGLDDVIAHGMLSMAYLGRMLRPWHGGKRLHELSSRFVAPVHVGDVLTCSAVVESVEQVRSGERVARLAMAARDQDGSDVIVGEALVGA